MQPARNVWKTTNDPEPRKRKPRFPLPAQTTQCLLPVYTSVVTFALALVTLTFNCLARARMSTRFRDETLCAIL